MDPLIEVAVSASMVKIAGFPAGAEGAGEADSAATNIGITDCSSRGKATAVACTDCASHA